MLVLVTYDVRTTTPEGRSRLIRIARICCGYGQRVQNSVFECQIDETTWAELRSRLLAVFDATEDSLRFYFLGTAPSVRNEQHGVRHHLNLEDPFIF